MARTNISKAALVGSVVVLAACGSSSHKSAPTRTTAPSATTATTATTVASSPSTSADETPTSVLRRRRRDGFSGGAAFGHSVAYKVSGTQPQASVVYSDRGGATDAQVNVPDTISVRLDSGAFFSLVAQSSASGSVTCEVDVDGKLVTTNTGRAGGLAECFGTVP